MSKPYSEWSEEKKEHVKAYYRKYHKENRDKSNAIRRRYRAKHREQIAAKRRADYDSEYNYGLMLKKVFNITLADYNKMFSQQAGKCAICGKHQKEQDNRMNVDHDHVTGKIRGLLCRPCNSGLGLFRDNTTSLIVASEYLKPALEYGMSAC